MTHTPELKPCPFCGGDAELDTMQGYRALSSGRLGNRATVYCTRCGADMGFCYEDAPGTPSEDIVNQVVDDWNRRSVNSLPALVKALEAARKFIADEYRDPAAEVYGHWLSAEARPVFDEICDALGSNPTVVLHGPYGWLVKPAGLNEEHWYLSSDPSSGADGEISVPLYATEEQELGALASHKTGG